MSTRHEYARFAMDWQEGKSLCVKVEPSYKFSGSRRVDLLKITIRSIETGAELERYGHLSGNRVKCSWKGQMMTVAELLKL